MRTSKAYIAGFGTTTLLVGSALLLLIVVSALVTFRGWPTTSLADDTGNLVINESKRAPAEPTVRVALEPPRPARAAVANAPAPRSPSASVTTTTTAATSGSATTFSASRVAPQSGTSFRDRGPNVSDPPLGNGGLRDPSFGLPKTPASPHLRRLTNGLGDTTQGITDGLGAGVGRLNPQPGQTLVDTGRALSDLLRALAQPRR